MTQTAIPVRPERYATHLCARPATARIQVEVPHGPPIPALVCRICAAAHQEGFELQVRYDPRAAEVPF